MSNNYVDETAITQVIGCIFNDASLLDETDKYIINEEDFPEQFHKIVIGSIYNLHKAESGITLEAISDYLAVRPKYEGIFKAHKGIEYLIKSSQDANKDTFNYYYRRMKKFTLLRAFNNIGLDVSTLYDPNNILDLKKKQKQEEWLDSVSLSDIAQTIDNLIEGVKLRYAEESIDNGCQAGEGVLDLIAELERHPEIGIPLYGSYINTVTRGARLGKFYLRSAPTGTGKTRSMIADACNFACNKIYDLKLKRWVNNGPSMPTLYISTEQDKSEIQTMMLAFISGVNEDHILDGKYLNDEKQRVLDAAKILVESPIWIEELPDFCLQDIENKIKKNIREHDVKYVVHDYIHTSMKILEEITRRSGGVKLREDNILFMVSIRLKDLCNKYGIFILSATQLNGDYKNSETPDQNLLRGAKSIADKIDVGMILLNTTDEDLIKLNPILAKNNFQKPNLKLSIYKNRRGAYKGVFLWCVADLSICRIQPIFCTTHGFEMVSIEDTRVIVDNDSAFSPN